MYNTFYVGENCDITIIAGCGIHNDSHDASEHDGIHSFYLREEQRAYATWRSTTARAMAPASAS